MAGGRIAGITIEIGGDTQGLNKALSGVNKDINKTQKELKDVNKLLKLDPKNTTLLAQKQKLLSKQIGSTKEKLAQLKTAEEQAREALEKGEIGQEQFDALQREIIETEQKLKNLEEEAKKIPGVLDKIGKAGEKIKGVGESVENVGKKMLPLTGAIAGFGTAAVKVTSDFKSSMSQVQATLGITKDSMSELNGETVNTMDALGDLAEKMGGETAFSAHECADAINYLALAGYSTQQIYDTLPSVLNLAAAGNMELAAASDMVTDSMSALGIETKDADIFVDKLAKTASSSNTSVAQLGNAILTVGGTAKTLSGGTTELNAALGILADNGIKGAEGGTKLRNILLKLNPTTDKAAQAWDQLGVSAYDADGNLRPLEDTFADLNKKMEGMSDEEKTSLLSKMFNAADLKAVNAMLATSSGRWDELTTAIDGSKGAAQQMADTQLDNLEGKITILKSAVEGLAIQFGEILMPYIIKLVEKIQNLVTWFSGLDENTKKIIVTIAGIVAVIGPMLIIIGKVMIFVGQLMTFLLVIAGALPTIGAAVSALAGPIGVVIGVIVALISVGYLVIKNWDKIKKKAIEVVNMMIAKFKDFVFKMQGVWKSVQDKAKSAFDKLKSLAKDAVDKIKSIFAKVKEYLTKPFTAAKDKIKGAIDSVKSVIEGLKDKMKSVANFKWLKRPELHATGGKAPWIPALGGQLPKITLSWHRKAMDNPYMLDSPTVFGRVKNTLLAGGEAGKEIVYGHSNLLNDIRNVVDQSELLNAVGMILNVLNQYLPSMKNDIVLDTGVLVGSTVRMYDTALGKIARRR